MKFHWGKTKHKGSINFELEGYYYQDIDDKEYSFIPYLSTKINYREILRIFGVSNQKRFIGVITYTKGKVK